MKQHRTPVAVLSGFLGSGKTTLLNHLLGNRVGLRIGVVVNDFGRINIDAMAVAGQVDSTVALGNGCLCCAVDTAGLDAMLERLARPGGEIDVIVIEASGLADPRGVVRMVLNSESERITYGGLIEVVDAAEFDDARAEHPQLEQHVRFADLVVLNKTDRVDGSTRDRLVDEVREIGGSTPVFPTAQGKVDPSLLFDTERLPRRDEGARQLTLDDLVHDGQHGDGQQEDGQQEDGEHADGEHADGEHADGEHEHHLHHGYESVEFTAERPIAPGRLMRFLDDRHAGIYRVKGFIDFDVPEHRQKFAFQAVGNFLRFRPTRWSRSERRTTQLVLIGRGMDAEAVRAALEACVRSDSESASEDDILPILRYTEQACVDRAPDDQP